MIFGLLASTSVGKLFIGGIVPGLLMGVFLLIASWLIARRRGFPAGQWQGFGELFAAALDSAFAVLTPFIVIVGLVFGVATTTEVGAVAALYAVLVSVFVYRELGPHELWASLCKAASDSAAVLVMASVAGIFTWLLANLGVGKALADWVGGLTRDPTLVLLLIVVLLLAAGTVLEPVTTLLVLVPLMIPAAHRSHPLRPDRRGGDLHRPAVAADRVSHLPDLGPGRLRRHAVGARARAVHRRADPVVVADGVFSADRLVLAGLARSVSDAATSRRRAGEQARHDARSARSGRTQALGQLRAKAKVRLMPRTMARSR